MKYFMYGLFITICLIGVVGGHISNVLYAIGFMLACYNLGVSLAEDNG